MEIGCRIHFLFEGNQFEGFFLEEQLSMFPDYMEANQDQIKLEIRNPDMRKQLNMGRKKTVIIDKTMLFEKPKKQIFKF